MQGKRWCVAALVCGVCLGAAKADEGRESDIAGLALDNAYTAAMEAPLETVCPRALIDIALACADADPEKARRLLYRARSWIASLDTYVETEPHSGKCMAYFGEEKSLAASARIELAQAAAHLDPELARECLAPIPDWRDPDFFSLQMFAGFAQAGLQLLDGECQQAKDTAYRVCSDPRWPSRFREEARRRATNLLLAFDPSVAVTFAAEYEPEFHMATLRKAAERLSGKDQERAWEYYARILAMYAAMEEPQGREGVRTSYKALAAQDPERALRLAREWDAKGEQAASEGKHEDEAARCKTHADALKCEVLRNDPSLEDEVGPGATPHAARALAQSAAWGWARQGKTRRAVRLALQQEEACDRVDALQNIVRAVAPKDKGKAREILKMAFEDAFLHQAHSLWLLHQITGEIAKYDAELAQDCYLLAAEYAIAGYGRRWDFERHADDISKALEGLAKVAPEIAIQLIREAPEVRWGHDDQHPHALDYDILRYLVVADPDMVYDVISGMPEKRRRRLQEIVIPVLARQDPEDVGRFLALVPNTELNRLVPDTTRFANDLLTGRVTPAQFLESFDAVVYGTPPQLADTFTESLSKVARERPDLAFKVVGGLPEGPARDAGLLMLAAHLLEEPADAVEAAGLVQDPALSMQAWYGAYRRAIRPR